MEELNRRKDQTEIQCANQVGKRLPRATNSVVVPSSSIDVMTAYQLTLPKKIEYIPNDDGIQNKPVRLKHKYFTLSSKDNIVTISLIKMIPMVNTRHLIFQYEIGEYNVENAHRSTLQKLFMLLKETFSV